MKLNLSFSELNSTVNLNFEEQNNGFELNFGEVAVVEKQPVAALPVVTEKDDGKVLKVHGGAWSIGNDNVGTALSNLEIENLIRNFN